MKYIRNYLIYHYINYSSEFFGYILIQPYTTLGHGIEFKNNLPLFTIADDYNHNIKEALENLSIEDVISLPIPKFLKKNIDLNKREDKVKKIQKIKALPLDSFIDIKFYELSFKNYLTSLNNTNSPNNYLNLYGPLFTIDKKSFEYLMNSEYYYKLAVTASLIGVGKTLKEIYTGNFKIDNVVVSAIQFENIKNGKNKIKITEENIKKLKRDLYKNGQLLIKLSSDVLKTLENENKVKKKKNFSFNF